MDCTIYEDIINWRELTSLNALVAWIADSQNVQQELVEEVIKAEFGVSNIDKIQRCRFEHAIRFLADLRLDKLN